MVTTLEQLPNEVFVQIFEHLSMRHLYRSFSRLNQRINSILGSDQTQLSFRWMRPEEIHFSFVTFFASRITKLLICHRNSLNLVRFPNIRHLQLERPTVEQCKEIQPHTMPHLEYLYINNSKTELPATTFDQLCSSIFSGQFPHLHTCLLVNVQFNHQWSDMSCVLRSIQIDVRNCQDISYLLQICPRLVRLKAMLDGEHFNFHHRNICQTLRKLNLYLRINNWSSEQFESFLLMMPNLESISVQTPFDQRSQITIESLAVILKRSAPNLKNFFINTALNRLSIIEDIDQLHPLFKFVRTSCLAATRTDYIAISSKIASE